MDYDLWDSFTSKGSMKIYEIAYVIAQEGGVVYQVGWILDWVQMTGPVWAQVLLFKHGSNAKSKLSMSYQLCVSRTKQGILFADAPTWRLKKHVYVTPTIMIWTYHVYQSYIFSTAMA
jgi:hypothetical protein